jgi:hypothetical protein
LFNGTILGVTAVLVYVAGISYAVYRVLLKRQEDHKTLISVRDTTISRLLFLITLFYTPLTSMILSVFNCKEVDGVWYINNDMRYQCFTPVHYRYRAAGAFWAAVYVAGIPLCYWMALRHYGVPSMARQVVDDAHLQNVVEYATRIGVEMPVVLMSEITTREIKDEFLNILFDALKGKKQLKGAQLNAIGDVKCLPSWHALARRFRVCQRAHKKSAAADGEAFKFDDARRLSRTVKINKLIHYSVIHLMPPVVTWHALRHSPHFRTAKQACGFIFEEFYACVW